jgi:hypothetical protein
MTLPIMDNLGVQFKNDKERAEFMSDRVLNHSRLQQEINIPYEIDHSEFQKTAEQKTDVKVMKKLWASKKK